MGKNTSIVVTLSCCLGFLFQGCEKNKTSVWDQNKSATHMQDAASAALWGDDALNNTSEGVFSISDEEFIALSEEDLKSQFAEAAVPQSNITPGEAGSGIPGISHFKNPTAILASIFRTVYFNTNQHIIRSQDSLNNLARAATHLIEHPNLYIFITGNCDERGPEAYNLALGARRANYVRSFLVKKGVNPDHIFTISYGKEKPVDPGHNHKAWAKNRRAEFKIYEKK